jgi:hypothetical protein
MLLMLYVGGFSLETPMKKHLKLFHRLFTHEETASLEPVFYIE